MSAPAELIERASEDLQSAREQAAAGLGSLDASYGALVRSVAHLQSAVSRWVSDPSSRGHDAWRALERFQTQLRIQAALHASAGALCAEWGRVLGGPGGQAYSPAGERLPMRVPRSQRVSLEA